MHSLMVECLWDFKKVINGETPEFHIEDFKAVALNCD